VVRSILFISIALWMSFRPVLLAAVDDGDVESRSTLNVTANADDTESPQISSEDSELEKDVYQALTDDVEDDKPLVKEEEAPQAEMDEASQDVSNGTGVDDDGNQRFTRHHSHHEGEDPHEHEAHLHEHEGDAKVPTDSTGDEQSRFVRKDSDPEDEVQPELPEVIEELLDAVNDTEVEEFARKDSATEGEDSQTEGNGDELNEETRQSDNETESAEEEKPRFVRNDSVDSDEDGKFLEDQEIENEVSRLVNGSDTQVTSRLLVREEEVGPVAVNVQDPLVDESSTTETSDGEEFDLRMRTIDLLTQAVRFLKFKY
jgi:hypothetical protein